MPLNLPTDNSRNGCLYIVATPIGNPKDITLRALEILKTVDLIAAEDTRQTGMLLRYHEIDGKMTSYHEHNEAERVPQLLKMLLSGQTLALVSDAGTPLLSDPGYRLVKEAAQNEIRVVPVPGACAAITALSASGLPTDRFLFIGFPPKKKGRRDRLLKEISEGQHTTIFYESPRRIIGFVDELQHALGDRNAVLSREITKRHEEFIRGKLSRIQETLKKRTAVKGECTLMISPHNTLKSTDSKLKEIEKTLKENQILEKGNINATAKALSKTYGIPKKQIYELALQLKKDGSG